MKVPYIELFEYNFLLSLMDFLMQNFNDKIIHGKKIIVVQSFSDISTPYKTPSLSAEVMYRKNRSVGFANYLGDEETENGIVEIEGTSFEYRIQLNVYSNTRGENNKWSSILDDILKNGEDGIKLNTYNDNGSIKQSSIGKITYDYSQDVKSNPMQPNIVTYDHHNIYEVKMNALQMYKAEYSLMEIGDIIGKLK